MILFRLFQINIIIGNSFFIFITNFHSRQISIFQIKCPNFILSKFSIFQLLYSFYVIAPKIYQQKQYQYLTCLPHKSTLPQMISQIKFLCFFLSDKMDYHMFQKQIPAIIDKLKDLMCTPESLTPSAIANLISNDAEEETIYVQVYGITLIKSGRLICTISDGNFFTKAFLNDDTVIKPEKDENSIICIKSHAALKNSVGIANVKAVAPYSQRIGDPKDWTNFKENAQDSQFNVVHYLQLKTSSQKQTLQKTETKKPLMNTQTTATPGKTSEYDSIPDLHIGFTRWTILCRITRKTLKESPKKGLKILQIELVDKSKKKITGTFFGETATEFNDYLKQQAVYQISKGRLREGNYNNSKNQMISPYTLIFDNKSTFNEVSDVNIIVKNEDTAITLGQVYDRHILHQDFDIVAYVIEVKEETTYQKNDKQFTVRDILIADPEARITMNARLWRWNQQIPANLAGKVIIFNRFQLNEYKGSISLSSNASSSLILTHDHRMKSYEGMNLDVSGFKTTTEIREKVDQNTSDFCHTIQELAEKIQNMGDGDVIKSSLYVWVTRMALSRKWCYEACPKCKKAAQKYSKCQNQNCGFVIEQTNLNFSMGIQVSDFCGSIWVTAYDELSKRIFYDMGNNAARQLQSLGKDELMEAVQKYHYQPMKLKIITKKDQEGRVRHGVGYLYELNDQKAAKDNLKMIQQLMG